MSAAETPEQMAERLHPMPDSLYTEAARGERRTHLAVVRAIRERDRANQGALRAALLGDHGPAVLAELEGLDALGAFEAGIRHAARLIGGGQ